jgi:hypothetical protein
MRNNRTSTASAFAAIAFMTGSLLVPAAAHAVYLVAGSARACGMADTQPLDCVHTSDGGASVGSASGSISHGGVTEDYPSFPGGPFTGSSSFSAALATGRMTASAVATGHGRAEGEVSVRDTLTFSGLAGGSNVIHFELTVTGTTSWDPPPGVTLPGGFGSGSASMVLARSTNVLASTSATFRVTDKTIARTLVLDYAVTPGAPTFDFIADLAARIDVAQLGVGRPVGGASMDLSRTARLSVVLPAGVTMTSSSGVFLTQPIPEPGTWAMLLAGLGVMGVAVRRRK